MAIETYHAIDISTPFDILKLILQYRMGGVVKKAVFSNYIEMDGLRYTFMSTYAWSEFQLCCLDFRIDSKLPKIVVYKQGI